MRGNLRLVGLEGTGHDLLEFGEVVGILPLYQQVTTASDLGSDSR